MRLKTKKTLSAIALAIILVGAGVLFIHIRQVWVSVGTFDAETAVEISNLLDENDYQRGRDYYFTPAGGELMIDAKRRNEACLLLAESGFVGDPLAATATDDIEARLRELEGMKTELRHMMLSRRGVRDFKISVPFVESASDSAEAEIPRTASAVIWFDTGFVPSDSDVKQIRSLILASFPNRELVLTDGTMRPLE